MKSIRKVLVVLTILIVISIQNKVLGIEKDYNNNSFFQGKTFSVESTKEEDSTNFQIRLMKGSVATFGRENWKKGDKIAISLESLNSNEVSLEVGILPSEDLNAGWGYNAYGAPIIKEIKTQEKVEFTIPLDGEYGIYVKDITPNKFSFLQIFRHKEIKSTKLELKNINNNYKFNLKNRNCIEFELEVNKKFINPLTK